MLTRYVTKIQWLLFKSDWAHNETDINLYTVVNGELLKKSYSGQGANAPTK